MDGFRKLRRGMRRGEEDSGADASKVRDQAEGGSESGLGSAELVISLTRWFNEM
jgi:hypothetical protein